MISSELEKYTFEYLLNEALERVPSDIDKREGSVIYDAIAPSCYQLAEMYINLKNIILNMFVQTSYGEYLENRVLEQGINRYLSTKSVKKGIFTFEDESLKIIEIGSRFRTINNENSLVYKVIEGFKDENNRVVSGEYLLECEESGTIGDEYVGDLLPLNYIHPLKTAQLTTLIKPARNDESDDELRKRYSLKVSNPSTSGNKYDYLKWALEVPGVGAANVFPLALGSGTVKIVIIDSKKQAATASLVKEVMEHIEDVRPIGSTVSVVSATEKSINISATIKVVNGINLGSVQAEFVKLLNEYLQSVSFKESYISIAKIGNILLNTPGLLDYSGLLVNDSTSNIALTDDEVAVSGKVALGGVVNESK